MRAETLALSVLLAATAAVGIRADAVPNLSGTWLLVNVTIGRDQRPVPANYVLTVRQQGPDISVETESDGVPHHVTRFTIGARKATINNGMETKGRVEKQTLIIEEKSLRACGLENFFADTREERRSNNGDGSASRRAMLNYSIEPICVNPVRRSTYRVSDDGATLEVAKPGNLRWRFTRQ